MHTRISQIKEGMALQQDSLLRLEATIILSRFLYVVFIQKKRIKRVFTF